MFDNVLRIGVTGLSRAGKTVFITSLVHSLLRASSGDESPPLRNFAPFDQGRLIAAKIDSGASSKIPKFPYREAVDALAGESPHWPKPTQGISSVRIIIRYKREGFFENAFFKSLEKTFTPDERQLAVELIDYPGEWLVDLPLLDLSFEEWSTRVMAEAQKSDRLELSRQWLESIREDALAEPIDDSYALKVVDFYKDYLKQCSESGYRYLQPGRFLCPADLENTPVLDFCPLPMNVEKDTSKESMYSLFKDRYQEYKETVIKDFYRKHFVGLDRQIVLVDVLAALSEGKTSFDDACQALSEILKSFQHGRSNLLSWLPGRTSKISKVLFACTKADHIARAERKHMEELLGKMLSVLDESNEIRMRTTEDGVKAMALASIRCTQDVRRVDTNREILRGRRAEDKDDVAIEPGAIPLDFPPKWNEVNFRFWDFQLPSNESWKYHGYPNIKLAEALNFLVGDEMQ